MKPIWITIEANLMAIQDELEAALTLAKQENELGVAERTEKYVQQIIRIRSDLIKNRSNTQE